MSEQVGQCISQIFSALYFDKSTLTHKAESLKQLLEERSHIVRKLELKPQRGNFEEVIETVLLLFNEEPLELEPANFLVLRQASLYYVFFSTDYKYIPLCKLCNWSVYITKSGAKGRVICCNPKCKRSVLEEFEVKSKLNLSANISTEVAHKLHTVPKQVATSNKKGELSKEQVLKAIDRMLK